MLQQEIPTLLWKGLTVSLPVVLLVVSFARGAESGEPRGEGGGFLRLAWSPAKRVRVNSPDAATGPYKDRWEAKEKGELAVPVADAPESIRRARLYLELWGGHPGVAEKSFTLNGHGYTLPEHGAAEDNCTYSYPLVELDVSHIVRGDNAFAFSCTKGTTFWGHYIIDNTCLVLDLNRKHPDIAKMGLASFEASVTAEPVADRPEALALSLSVPEGFGDKIASAEYVGRYYGYDENGDGDWSDWHAFTKGREPQAIIGRADAAPYKVVWDLTIVPDQEEPMQVRALVRFKADENIVYVTAPLANLHIPGRGGHGVGVFPPEGLPRPFWSRAAEEKKCVIPLGVGPEEVERAQLHVNIWDGGRGETAEPFTLNGRALPVAGEGAHDLIYRVIEVDPSILKKGANEVRLLSDTEHHGIEICLPGPTLVVRYREGAAAP